MSLIKVGDVVCDKYDAYRGKLTKGVVIAIHPCTESDCCFYESDCCLYEIEWQPPRDEFDRFQDEFYLIPLELAEAYIEESKKIDEAITNGTFGTQDQDFDTLIPTYIVVEKLIEAQRANFEAKKQSGR